MFFVGWGIGAIVLGSLADRYGRRKLIIPSVAVSLLMVLACPFMPTIHLVVFFRLVIGFVYPGVSVQVQILLAEIVGNKYRPVATNIPTFAFPTAWVLLGLKAYLLKNWKLLSIVCTVPYGFVLAFHTMIPESVRWLHLNNHSDEAMSIFHKIARWNKKNLPSTIRICPINDIGAAKSNVCDIFRTKNMALKSFAQMCLWMVLGLISYGLQFAANDLEGSVYRDFVLISSMTYPSNILSIAACLTIGRKKGTLVPLLIGGTACLAIAWIPLRGSLKVARITMGITGRLAAATAFHTVYLWSAELFPTNVRGTAIGVLQVFARVGSASSPWIVKGLGAFGTWIPFAIIGVASLIASAIGLYLPETKETRLEMSFDLDKKRIEGCQNPTRQEEC